MDNLIPQDKVLFRKLKEFGVRALEYWLTWKGYTEICLLKSQRKLKIYYKFEYFAHFMADLNCLTNCFNLYNSHIKITKSLSFSFSENIRNCETNLKWKFKYIFEKKKKFSVESAISQEPDSCKICNTATCWRKSN